MRVRRLCRRRILAKKSEEFLYKYLELPNDIPDSDTFRRVFLNLNPEELSECLVNLLDVKLPERNVITADGKTIYGSRNKDHKAYHIVSTFVAESQITLREITVEKNSNEITAVLELLDLVYIDGTIITGDSMSCQKKTVRRSLKENQIFALNSKKTSLIF